MVKISLMESTDNSNDGWDLSFLKEIGLEDLSQNQFEKIGTEVGIMGTAIGHGLTQSAASFLGLNPGTPVGIGIVDAHAGALGALATPQLDSDHLDIHAELDQRLALIAGTSACHLAVSINPIFTPGIWGPFYNALLPNMWLTEGGQSAVGSLIDRIIFNHSSIELYKKETKEKGFSNIFELLNFKVENLAKEKGLTHLAYLTKNIHVLPYFHGNRSPRADPSLTGMICGLTLDTEDLPLQYVATLQALAHGTKHIIDTMNTSGYHINKIIMTGGFRYNRFFMQEIADITRCSVIVPKEDAVLLGTAILGAVAAKEFSDIFTAMKSMSNRGEIIYPTSDSHLTKYHSAKYQILQLQYEHQMIYTNIMDALNST